MAYPSVWIKKCPFHKIHFPSLSGTRQILDKFDCVPAKGWGIQDFFSKNQGDVV